MTWTDDRRYQTTRTFTQEWMFSPFQKQNKYLDGTHQDKTCVMSPRDIKGKTECKSQRAICSKIFDSWDDNKQDLLYLINGLHGIEVDIVICVRISCFRKKAIVPSTGISKNWKTYTKAAYFCYQVKEVLIIDTTTADNFPFFVLPSALHSIFLLSDRALIDRVLLLIRLICAINNIYQTLGLLIQSFITLVMRHDYN